MDPLLKSLTDSSFKQLVQEQRPEWAVPLGQGRPGVEASYVPEGPPLPQAMQALRGRAAQAFEYGQDPARMKDPFIKRIFNAIIALGDKRAREGLPKPYDVAEGFFNPVPGVAGVLVGARAAKNLGGLVEGKFHAGVQALERGEAPQAVWRTWGVAKNAEGKYVFEPPLRTSESDALAQFQQLYPDVALKVYRAGGAREGYYDPKSGEIFAQGKGGGDPTAFESRRRVLEHELQHKADDLEGMSYGTRLEDPSYWNNAAEVRARAVEQRLDPRERVWEPSFHEDVDRMQQVIKQHPGAVAEAVKEPGGMWHPEAVERLAEPLYSKLTNLGRQDFAQLGPDARNMARELQITEAEVGDVFKQKAWSDRAIRNYLNKYAGTERDPLKDVEVPFGEGVKRWEELTDSLIKKGEARNVLPLNKDYKDYVTPGSPFQHDPVHYLGRAEQSTQASGEAIQSYLSHVGDYLRQNVPPEKLAQYDLVRAVKETAANDARVAKEMEKAAQASMKDLPVYKDYGDGFKWVELKAPEKLTEAQMKSLREASNGERSLPHTYQRRYVARDAAGRDIVNSYTGEGAFGKTPEEAYLAGQLAQEGNQMGHCVGGYCEGVAAGESRIFSLRDAKGKSHVTVEVTPRYEGGERPGTVNEWVGEDIVQIKGKQNRAPAPAYLPYVQDFVKNGRWGEVGDLQNTGLGFSKTKGYITHEEAKQLGLQRASHSGADYE